MARGQHRIAVKPQCLVDETTDRWFILDQEDRFTAMHRVDRFSARSHLRRLLLSPWEIDPEYCAMAGGTLYRDTSSALLDNAIDG